MSMTVPLRMFMAMPLSGFNRRVMLMLVMLLLMVMLIDMPMRVRVLAVIGLCHWAHLTGLSACAELRTKAVVSLWRRCTIGEIRPKRPPKPL